MKPTTPARALTIASVVLLISAACVERSTNSTLSDVPLEEQTAGELSPMVHEALAVATTFVEGRSERNIEKMTDNSIEGFINGLVVLSLAEMPAEFAWQEAVEWRMQLEGCEVTEADETTPTIRCDVNHHNTISRALGVGPYPGSYHIKVLFAGDEMLGVPITATMVTESHQTEFPILDFTNQTWRPFITWLEETHPEDIDLMLGPAVEPGVEFMVVAGQRKPSLNEGSVSLWQQYSAEFAAEFTDS